MTATSAKLCPLCGARSVDRAVCEHDGQALINDLSGAELAGRYTLVALAGVGAQGSTVWEAESPDGPVAVKLIDVKPGQPLEPVLDHIVAQLSVNCPACIRAIDSGIWHGRVYVVTPLLDLDALSDHLDAEPQPDKARRFGRALLEALVPLHAAGRAHGNLHPANIFIDETTDPMSVLLLDAEQGAACFWSREPGDPLTLEPTRVFAPEQLAADELEPATDVYQVGALMYRIATGRPVFETTDVEHLVRLKMTAAPNALAGLDDTPHLRTLLSRALSPRLSQRHLDASAMLEALTAPPPAPVVPVPVVSVADAPGFVLTDAPMPMFASAPDTQPPVSGPPLSGPPLSGPPLALDAPDEPPRRRGMLLLLLLLLGVGGAAWLLRDRLTDQPTPDAATAAAANTRSGAALTNAPPSALRDPSSPGLSSAAAASQAAANQAAANQAAASRAASQAAGTNPAAVDSAAVDSAAGTPPVVPPSGAPRVPVAIDSQPAGAAVLLDGEYAGKTPWRSQLTDGQYTIALSLPRYVDKAIDLRVDGDPVDIKARLVRKSTRRRIRQRAARAAQANPKSPTPANALASAPDSPGGVPLLDVSAPAGDRVELLGAPTRAGVTLLGAPARAGVKLLGAPARADVKLLGAPARSGVKLLGAPKTADKPTARPPAIELLGQ